jgi:protein FAM32A
MKPVAFARGSLSFKGDKKKPKKKTNKVKNSLKAKHLSDGVNVVEGSTSNDQTTAAWGESNIDEDDLTDAEKKALLRKQERERIDLIAVASKSHRERIEDFNEKLGQQTELNDIPRVRIVDYILKESAVCMEKEIIASSCFILKENISIML